MIISERGQADEFSSIEDESAQKSIKPVPIICRSFRSMCFDIIVTSMSIKVLQDEECAKLNTASCVPK